MEQRYYFEQQIMKGHLIKKLHLHKVVQTKTLLVWCYFYMNIDAGIW